MMVSLARFIWEQTLGRLWVNRHEMTFARTGKFLDNVQSNILCQTTQFVEKCTCIWLINIIYKLQLMCRMAAFINISINIGLNGNPLGMFINFGWWLKRQVIPLENTATNPSFCPIQHHVLFFWRSLLVISQTVPTISWEPPTRSVFKWFPDYSRRIQRMWKMKVFPEQSGFLIARGSVRPQWSPCPELISFLLGCLTGRNVSETTNSNRLRASAARHTLFELKLSASSRHHHEDKSFIFWIFSEGTCPGDGGWVIIQSKKHKSSLV